MAVLLPSYGRERDLITALSKTPIRDEDAFIVVANYPDQVLERLKKRFGSRAHFVDERAHGRLGGAGAYNLAFAEALARGYRYTIHYADDVLPDSPRWIADAVEFMQECGADIGVFSSDECHIGAYGWNIVGGAPIAHFFIGDTQVVTEYFDPKYHQYFVDLEISARTLEKGGRVALLPVKLRHYRSPLARPVVDGEYNDQEIFLQDYPHYRQAIGDNRERMLPHAPSVTVVSRGADIAGLVPWPPHRSSLVARIRRRLLRGR